MSTTVTSKGQVTIPKAVRELLGIHPGSRVDFRRLPDGQVVVELADAEGHGAVPASRFSKAVGSFQGGLTTDEIMQLTRGEP